MPLDAIAAYLNFDMVGRMQDNNLTVQATGTSPVWAKVLEQANIAAGFDLMVQQDEMNRLFEDVTQRRARGESKPQDDLERADWIPAADVYEQENGYVIALDLPGVDRSARRGTHHDSASIQTEEAPCRSRNAGIPTP